MYQEIIRQKLIAAREEIGYTQQQVADSIEEPRSKLSKIELGMQMPDVETLGKLAELYSISFDWLFGVGPKRPGEAPLNRRTEKFSHQKQIGEKTAL